MIKCLHGATPTHLNQAYVDERFLARVFGAPFSLSCRNERNIARHLGSFGWSVYMVYMVTIVQVHRTVITRGLQIGPMRKCALHFLNIISSLYLILSFQAHTPFSFHTNLLRHLAPMISTV